MFALVNVSICHMCTQLSRRSDEKKYTYTQDIMTIHFKDNFGRIQDQWIYGVSTLLKTVQGKQSSTWLCPQVKNRPCMRCGPGSSVLAASTPLCPPLPVLPALLLQIIQTISRYSFSCDLHVFTLSRFKGTSPQQLFLL